LGNIHDYDDSRPEPNLLIKSALNHIKKVYENNLRFLSKDEYNFNSAIKAVMNELNNGVISYLLDYSKDYLYVLEANNDERRMIQFALSEVLKYILYTMAPFIPVTIEEA